jgi:hypothetical protein
MEKTWLPKEAGYAGLFVELIRLSELPESR